MKNNKMRCACLTVICFVVFSSNLLFAQEWSAEQQEVWRSVESAWVSWANKDIDGALANIHDNYSGWDNNNPLPNDKDLIRKYIPYWFKTGTVVIYDIQPVGINIFDNVAIVHYYWSNVIKDAEGKEINQNGRWTDILLKQGDKWVLIADSGGTSASN